MLPLLQNEIDLEAIFFKYFLTFAVNEIHFT